MQEISLPPINQRIKELIEILQGGNISKFAQSLGIGDSQKINRLFLIDKRNGKYPTPSGRILQDIVSMLDVSHRWLLYGEGEMFNSSHMFIARGDIANFVSLLPVSAQGGSLNDFICSVNENDCEKILSPIKGADFAITVSGSSMEPEYPSGSKILIKKINEKLFIEWGRCYVLDTCNGIVIKKITAPTESDPQYGYDYINCVSVNPDPIYAPFRIPTNSEFLFGVYRVLMQLVEK